MPDLAQLRLVKAQLEAVPAASMHARIGHAQERRATCLQAHQERVMCRHIGACFERINLAADAAQLKEGESQLIRVCVQGASVFVRQLHREVNQQ